MPVTQLPRFLFFFNNHIKYYRTFGASQVLGASRPRNGLAIGMEVGEEANPCTTVDNQIIDDRVDGQG